MNAYKFSTLKVTERIKTQYGIAWLALCMAFISHIIDEALTDFLSVYNPTINTIRKSLPFLPLPTFTFEVWLTGLILVAIILLFFSLFAFRGAYWMLPLSYTFAVIMLANGLLHIVTSIYINRLMPGVYSSPLLLGSSIYLVVRVRQLQRLVSDA